MVKEKPDISEHENRSLFSLIGDVPRLISAQVRNEFDLLKRELLTKLKQVGVGSGMMILAIPVLVLAIIMLIIAGMYALALVVPEWAAALIVAGALIFFAAILVIIGLLSFKKFSTPLPKRTLENVQEDVDTITGKND